MSLALDQPQGCTVVSLVEPFPQKDYIAHKKISELIPKQIRFGNSSTKITEYNSQSNSVRGSVILCIHYSPRTANSRNKSVR